MFIVFMHLLTGTQDFSQRYHSAYICVSLCANQKVEGERKNCTGAGDLTRRMLIICPMSYVKLGYRSKSFQCQENISQKMCKIKKKRIQLKFWGLFVRLTQVIIFLPIFLFFIPHYRPQLIFYQQGASSGWKFFKKYCSVNATIIFYLVSLRSCE